MPEREAPCVELGNAPETPSVGPSPSPSVSSASSLEPQNIRPTPLFRALAMTPPEPDQPPGQDELERRLPGYRRIVIPRDLTLIELLKQSSGANTDEEVLRIREVRLRVVAEQIGLRRLHVLAPRLRALTLDGSAVSSLRDLGIGLVHLRMLSVNRCGLTCLDGVWGLSALREFHAAGNKLQDLQPLAALQKLHTLSLADNPIAESGRLWTLGVCGSLRHLTLRGTPMAAATDYRARVASALPLLLYLDDRPLHVVGDEESSLEPELRALQSDTDSECEADTTAPSMSPEALTEPQPGTSGTLGVEESPELGPDGDSLECYRPAEHPRRRRRPATSACAGTRPARAALPPRPRTALAPREKPGPSRLHVMSTLMDEEWRCSGSELTSRGAVCGNLAHALRRVPDARRRSLVEEERLLLERSMAEAKKTLASEIPRAPSSFEDWVKFKEQTGIDIDIDFNERLNDGDATRAIERLESIERETLERLKQEAEMKEETYSCKSGGDIASVASFEVSSDCDVWTRLGDGPMADPRLEVDVLFKNLMTTTVESKH
ncbi:uncharacterized protein [Choristoneura fumiferana]|uniref:uncharacterized protein n=1 Tax=Choristoneura fumiferana TaxID=7141 RepID=UPI003D1540F2